MRSYLKHDLHRFLPEGTVLQVVTCAKDLGVGFSFGRRPGLGANEARLQEGYARLERLEQAARPPLKMQLLTCGVWPASFYSMGWRANC